MKLKTIITTLIILFSLSCFSQQKKDTSDYKLVGKLELFQLAYASIVTPDDVTTNQKKAVAKWLESIKIIPPPKTDSTTIQKKPK